MKLNPTKFALAGAILLTTIKPFQLFFKGTSTGKPVSWIGLTNELIIALPTIIMVAILAIIFTLAFFFAKTYNSLTETKTSLYPIPFALASTITATIVMLVKLPIKALVAESSFISMQPVFWEKLLGVAVIFLGGFVIACLFALLYNRLVGKSIQFHVTKFALSYTTAVTISHFFTMILKSVSTLDKVADGLRQMPLELVLATCLLGLLVGFTYSFASTWFFAWFYNTLAKEK